MTLANVQTGIIAEVVGHMGDEPEMRFTPDGEAVTNFSVATYGYKESKDGKQETMWVRCSAWKEMAEAINNVPGLKGCKVKMVGLYWDRSWTSKDGKKSGTEHKLSIRSFAYGHKEDLDWTVIRVANKKGNDERDQQPGGNDLTEAFKLLPADKQQEIIDAALDQGNKKNGKKPAGAKAGGDSENASDLPF